MKSSIFNRLLYTYLLLFISVILILVFVFTEFINISYYNMKKNQLVQEGNRLSSLVEKYGFENLAGSQMKDALDLIGYVTNSSVYVLRTNNLEEFGPQIQSGQNGDLTEDIRAVASGEQVARRIRPGNIDMDVIFVGVPIYIKGNEEGAVLFFSPLNEIGEVLNRMYTAAWVIGLAFILLASAVIYAVSRRVSGPIIRMADTARMIAEGNFPDDIIINGSDETALLADSFNYMKNKLHRVEKMRQELISNISHELRTPLTTIRGFIQGILDGMVKPEEERQYLEIALGEVGRMTNLVGDLLELSKLQTGSIKLHKSEIQAEELVKDAAKEFEMEFRNKGIEIFINAEKGLMVTADKDRIKQVLINLIGNAVKFTPKGGNITVTAEMSDRWALFRVGDTGPGIPAENLPYIFDRFYRGDSDVPGHGLGLAIAKELVELHGGAMWAKSKQGKGTEIFFKIPL